MSKIKGISSFWNRLFAILGKEHRRKYNLMVLLSIISAILEVIGISALLHTVLSILKPTFIQHNIFTSFLYDLFEVKDNQTFILIMTILLFVLYVVKNIILVQVNRLQVRNAFEITDGLSSDFFNNIARKELLYFKNRKSSEIINEIFAVSLVFPEGIILTSIGLISEMFIVVLMLGAILIYNPLLFIFSFLILFPAAGVLIHLNRKRLGEKGERVHEILPQIFENISELTNGIENVKLWNGRSFFYNRFSRLKKETYKLKEDIYVSSQFVPMRIYEVIAIAGILCVVVFGVLNGQGTSSIISYISIFAAVSFRLLPSVNKIISNSNALATNIHLLGYLEYEKDDETSNNLSKLPFNGSICLDNVSFSYEENAPILNHLNLKIEKGEFIGIVGSSGNGKSTLVNVIASLLAPTKGSLHFDGKEISKNDISAYRYLFSYVKQDVFMLNASIFDNVAFLSQEVDEVKIKNCFELVNLTEWIDGLPEGGHTSVGELGSQISGGQKQRIAIARALYKDAEIFIFDEVTNNLDIESREQTIKAISSLKKTGKTAIFITHKYDELEYCDSVYRLENGVLCSYEKD